MSANISKHKVGDEIVEVARNWHQSHIAANYHEIEWGEHSHPEHDLIGEWNGIVVEHIDGEESPTGGPEFKLTFPNGAAITVLCADVVKQYIEGEVG